MRPRNAVIVALVAIVLSFLALAGGDAHADEGWTIDSYDVSYNIDQSGLVHVTEDLRVDFGFQEKHGIFRDMPVRYEFDDKNDRLISVGNVTVDDGAGHDHPFELIESGPNLRIKIGDADKLISGKQRYRISYLLTGAMNPFSDHDEFFWNVTGNAWPVQIDKATATVRVPESDIDRITCFQGATGSKDLCDYASSGSSASFTANGTLFEGEGLTIVVSTRKGAIAVGPPVLAPKEKNGWEKFIDLFDATPITVGATAVLSLLIIAAVFRLWWVEGRDRWLGDMFYLNEGDGSGVETAKPIMAHESLVVEFTPPDLDRRAKRRLRPAEIGVLLDERADTLDVSATIVDLAVRKHLKITEVESGGFLGMFKKKDYQLDRLDNPQDELLTYESQLKDALFDTGASVKLSDLKNKFAKDLAKVKKSLYSQAMTNGFFAQNPETVTTISRVAGIVIAAIGAGLVYGLGWLFGGGFIGIPVIVAGLAIFFLSPAMPRRTGKGRVLYRRSLGFRQFMVRAETERQKFAENANIFHEYLPYAIVYGCVDRWAKVFRDLGLDPGQPDYYVGPGPFLPLVFAESMASFSNSISTTMASTPGGSGGSGFGGGSGGGGGGGGGGSW